MPKPVQHPEILVQARRGGTVESLHRACAALAGPDGEIVERWGDPGMVTYWRSSAKPLQAQAWLADGTVEHWGWGAEELAIMSASHEGLDFQADLVRRMLADLGLTEAGPALRRQAQGAAQLLRQPHRVPRRLRAPRLGRAHLPAAGPPRPAGGAQGVRGHHRLGRSGAGHRRRRLRHRLLRDAGDGGRHDLRPAPRAAARDQRRDARPPRAGRGAGLHRHRGHARPPRRHQQVRRRGAQLLLAAGRARPRRQGRRRRRPRPRAGRPRRARGGRRRRRDERRAAPASPGRRSPTTPATSSASCWRSSPSDAGPGCGTRLRAVDRPSPRGAGRVALWRPAPRGLGEHRRSGPPLSPLRPSACAGGATSTIATTTTTSRRRR